MQPVVWSFLGACVALVIRYFVDRYERVQEKRRTCPHHHFKVVQTYNYKTRICEDCGYQEPIKEDK